MYRRQRYWKQQSCGTMSGRIYGRIGGREFFLEMGIVPQAAVLE